MLLAMLYVGNPSELHFFAAAALIYFVCCGEGLYGGVWALGPCELHPLVLLFVLSGTLMISKTLRIPKF